MTHEIGHMFGIRHCIYYECGMNGANHIEEIQNSPLYYCAVCFRKLQYAVGFDVMERYQKLINVCGEFGGLFVKDGEWLQRRYQDLEAKFEKLQPKNSTVPRKINK